MQYLSIPPGSRLALYVERFWYSSDALAYERMRVVPSGTMELVFNLDEDVLGFYGGGTPASYRSFSGAVFSGAHSQPLLVETRKHVIGVHFKPGGAFRFLGIPARELANTHGDVEVVWGKIARDVRERIILAQSPVERFRVLEAALIARLNGQGQEHRVVRAAVDILAESAGEVRTRDLAERLGLSQRHLIKVFSDQVGVTPKQFARVQRFQRALTLAESRSPADWADIAVRCGYFDQSHLIHEFRDLAGLSPVEWQQDGGLLPNRPPTA